MKKLLLEASVLVLLTGCMTVPQTEIIWPTKAGPVSIKSPKQFSAEEIGVTANTDGSVTVKLKNMKSENDSSVLGVVAAARAEEAQANWEGMNQFLQKAIEGFKGTAPK